MEGSLIAPVNSLKFENFESCKFAILLLQWNLSWETTAMRDHLFWRATYSWWKVLHFKTNEPSCPQKPPLLRDHIFIANRVVFQDRFYCTPCTWTVFNIQVLQNVVLVWELATCSNCKVIQLVTKRLRYGHAEHKWMKLFGCHCASQQLTLLCSLCHCNSLRFNHPSVKQWIKS